MRFLLPLINMGIIIEKIVEGFYWVCMVVDSVFYKLVAYSFKIFQLMCSINLNTITGVITPVLNAVKSVIIVYIVYLLGISLIKYMLTPDKAMEGGKKILVNLLIATALFISYETIFSFLNEVHIALMGNPAGYPYETIDNIFGLDPEDKNKKDIGVIMRVLFNQDENEEIVDPSMTIARHLAGTFIRDADSDSHAHLDLQISTKEKGVYNFDYLYKDRPDTNGGNHYLPEKIRIGTEVEYTFLLGMVTCIFVIYSMFKASIQVGIRMFKLLILQLVAPIVIFDIIQHGFSGKFQTWSKKYIAVYLEAMIRFATVMITTVFVCKFLIHISEFIPTLQTSDSVNIFTRLIVIIIIVIAAYTFAGQIPKFIDEIIGTHIADTSKGNFVGGLLGGAAGLVTGGIAGAMAGGNVLGGMITGAGKGAVGGSKGEKVSDFFKNQKDVAAGSIERAARIRDNKNGFLGGMGYNLGKSTGATDIHNAKIDKKKKQMEDTWKNNFKAAHGGQSYDQYIEAQQNQQGALQDQIRDIDSISEAVEREAAGSGIMFNGINFDWNTSDDDIIAADSSVAALKSSIDHDTAERDSLIEKRNRARSSTARAAIDADIHALENKIKNSQKNLIAAEQTARSVIQGKRDNIRDATSTAISSGTSVISRTNDKASYTNQITAISNDIRNITASKQQLDRDMSDLDKGKIS